MKRQKERKKRTNERTAALNIHYIKANMCCSFVRLVFVWFWIIWLFFFSFVAFLHFEYRFHSLSLYFVRFSLAALREHDSITLYVSSLTLNELEVVAQLTKHSHCLLK